MNGFLDKIAGWEHLDKFFATNHVLFYAIMGYLMFQVSGTLNQVQENQILHLQLECHGPTCEALEETEGNALALADQMGQISAQVALNSLQQEINMLINERRDVRRYLTDMKLDIDRIQANGNIVPDTYAQQARELENRLKDIDDEMKHLRLRL